MKLFTILLIIVFLTGCTALCPQQKQSISQDQQNFTQAFDDFKATNRIDKLQNFRADYPDSAWAGRAEIIILYSQELDQRKLQMAQLQECQQQDLDLKELKKLNQQLTEKIEQLKSLLIQSEKQPK